MSFLPRVLSTTLNCSNYRVGQKDRLSRLGIPVVKNQPGVGEYLQNYLMSILPTHLKVEGIAPGIKVLSRTRLDEEEQE